MGSNPVQDSMQNLPRAYPYVKKMSQPQLRLFFKLLTSYTIDDGKYVACLPKIKRYVYIRCQLAAKYHDIMHGKCF